MESSWAVDASVACPVRPGRHCSGRLATWPFPVGTIEFPRDHQNHPEFKTEWWYFTGNLKAADGRPFGYQLTFFRQGILPLDSDMIPLSHFVTNSVKFAHFALSDLSAGNFRFAQKVSRGSLRRGRLWQGKQLAWIEEWSCTLDEDGAFLLKGTPTISL